MFLINPKPPYDTERVKGVLALFNDQAILVCACVSMGAGGGLVPLLLSHPSALLL